MSSIELQQGAIVTVTGAVDSFTNYRVTLTRGNETLVKGRPVIGSAVRLAGSDSVYTLEKIDIAGHPVLSNGLAYHWIQLKQLSVEEYAEHAKTEELKKRDAWQKQAMEIPIEILLDVIKERTKAQ